MEIENIERGGEYYFCYYTKHKDLPTCDLSVKLEKLVNKLKQKLNTDNVVILPSYVYVERMVGYSKDSLERVREQYNHMFDELESRVDK